MAVNSSLDKEPMKNTFTVEKEGIMQKIVT